MKSPALAICLLLLLGCSGPDSSTAAGSNQQSEAQTEAPIEMGDPEKEGEELTLAERADAAVAEIMRIREKAKTGVTAEMVRQKVGDPDSVESQNSVIAEAWRYDIDDTVYFIVNFNSDAVVVGTFSSGIKELIRSDD